MKKNLCILCADEGYLEKTKALISSAHLTGKWDGDFMVISNVSNPKIKQYFLNRGIYYVCVNDAVVLFSKYFNASALKETHWPIAILLRYILFYLDVFKHWERVLYLDCDMLVLEQMEFVKEEGDMLVVRDHYLMKRYLEKYQDDKKKTSKIVSSLRREFGIDPRDPTFNSGFFMINPKMMTEEKRQEFERVNTKYLGLSSLPDQFVMNIVFYKEKKFINTVYNYNFVFSPDGEKTRILHSLYVPKVWDRSHPVYSDWKRYSEAFDSLDLDDIDQKDCDLFYSEFEFQMKEVFGDVYAINAAKNRDVHDFFSCFPQKGVGAEVGVACGDYAESLWNNLHPQKMYLIDCWEAQYGTGFELDGCNFEDHDANLAKCIHRFYNQIKRSEVKIIKNYSLQALPTFPDDHFDWIYLDANNTYEYIYETLKILDKKVKKDGVIAGHDFVFQKWMKYGVISAVKDFCENYNWEIMLVTNEMWRSYIIRRKK